MVDKIQEAQTTAPRSASKDWPKPEFYPIGGTGKDRFGNKIFYSPQLAYFDREGNPVSAGILLSPQGQELLKRMPGVLTGLNTAIENLGGSSWRSSDPVEFRYGKLIDTKKGGYQSYVFFWETPSGEKYVIKVPIIKPENAPDTSQPYLNEMLQTQEMADTLSNETKIENVHLPTFLFASGFVSCTQFVDGSHDFNPKQSERLVRFSEKLHHFVNNQRESGKPLFSNIKTDMLSPKGEPATHNALVTREDKIVIIDPFFYAAPRG